jgi:hypothetical protein
MHLLFLCKNYALICKTDIVPAHIFTNKLNNRLRWRGPHNYQSEKTDPGK